MQTSDSLQLYYRRVVPILPELFNMAHAICGNYELAEYAVQYTLMEGWHGESHGGMGFREGLRGTLKRISFEEAMQQRGEETEISWDRLNAESDDPALGLLAAENAEIRRMLALRYGCGMSCARIARLTGAASGEVRAVLRRFEQRVARRLPPQEQRRAEAYIARKIAQAFRETDDSMPSPGAIYRAFEAEASESQRPGHWIARIARGVLWAVFAATGAGLFWLMAALMRPA